MKNILAILYISLVFPSVAQTYSEELKAYRQDKLVQLNQDNTGPIQKNQIEHIHFYEPNEKMKVKAMVEILHGENKFDMPTYSGTTNPYVRYATLYFKIDENNLSLTCYKNLRLSLNPKYKDYLFLPFKDSTNGDDTYEGGRYLELDISDIQNGVTTIDFNKSYNPYCAYNNGYNCPIPPIENHLDFPIFAGEKKYTGPKNERTVLKEKEFTAKERQLIHSGKATEAMHIYLTTHEEEFVTLKKKSLEINPKDSLLTLLSQRMLATVQDPSHSGVGIAAPQVGINKSLIWVQRFDKEGKPFEFFVNPEIIWTSALLRKGLEGCLSIPERKEEVERSYAIRLRYTTLEGKDREENIEGFTAVIFQHEVDHLLGILYTDRIDEQYGKDSLFLNEKINFSIEKGHILP